MSGEYPWNDRLTALNKLLADLYPTEDASRRVVVLAGLPPAFIKFHDAALITWYNVLDEARKRGRVEAIIGVARDDFPGHEDLARLAQPTGISAARSSPTDPTEAKSNSSSDAGTTTVSFKQTGTDWPAPGSADTELGVLMELEVGHGETKVHAGVQA